jgi:Holliday junction resolvase RusA-like endonuclease
MIEPVTFVVPGPPHGQQRTGGSGKRRFTQSKTRSYEAAVGTYATLAMRGRPPITECCALSIRAIFLIPESWTPRKRDRAILGEIRPGVKPDLDNIIKSICDGMNGIVVRDDALICDYTQSTKVYGVMPMVVVCVKGLSGWQS